MHIHTYTYVVMWLYLFLYQAFLATEQNYCRSGKFQYKKYVCIAHTSTKLKHTRFSTMKILL